jgi:hypothetical protein
LAVNEDDIEWLQITIKDEANSLVHFNNSPEKSLIKLHFRPMLQVRGAVEGGFI